MPRVRRRIFRWIGAFGLVALSAIVMLSAAPWPASSYRHTDFFQFWASAEALIEGVSPYDRSWYEAFAERVGSRALEFWPAGWVSPYPMWTDVLTLPLPLLPYRVATATWLVAQILGLAAVLGILGRRMIGTGPAYLGIALSGIAIAFEPLWALVGGGNIVGFVAIAWGGAVMSSLSGHALLAGSLLGLLIVKPQLSIAFAPLLFVLAPVAQRWPLALGAAGVAGVLALVSFALRPTWLFEWIQPELVGRMSSESNATVWTLDRVLPAPFHAGLVPVVIAALAAALFVVWWRWRRPELPATLAGGTALALFIAPHARHYDQVLLLVTAALLIKRIAELDARRRAFATALAAASFIIVPWWLYTVAVARGTPRIVVDLHEEWSALVPLLALAIVIVVDLLGAPRSGEERNRHAAA